MFQRQFGNRFKLGRFLGIDVFIHWTFWILFFGVGASQLLASEADWQTSVAWVEAGFAMAQIAVLFLCVTLHEYGHAMMARYFGVRTIDITLLPIGGLARLERMPRRPLEEFLVAVAGPAVNVVIAGGAAVALFFAMRADDVVGLDETFNYLSSHSLGGLFLINMALVIFNMVPAFPMDGGRVLRSLLASFLNYGKATRVAARIGFVIALAMAVLGFLNGQITIVLIAAFIGYAGWVEARQVALADTLSQIRVEQWAQPVPIWLKATDGVDQLSRAFAATALPCLPVVGVNDHFLGLLDRTRLAEALRSERQEWVATDLMREDEAVLEAPGGLESQLSAMKTPQHDPVAVVDARGQFVGLLFLRQVLAAIMNQNAQSSTEPVEAVLVEPPQQA